MRLELDNHTIFTIIDAMKYYKQLSSYDAQDREMCYAKLLDAFVEAERAEQFELEMMEEINHARTLDI